MDKEYKQFFVDVANHMAKNGLQYLKHSVDIGSFDNTGPYRSIYILNATRRDGYTRKGYVSIQLDRIGFHAGKPLPRRRFASGIVKMYDIPEVSDCIRGPGFTYVENDQEVFDEFLLGLDRLIFKR